MNLSRDGTVINSLQETAEKGPITTIQFGGAGSMGYANGVGQRRAEAGRDGRDPTPPDSAHLRPTLPALVVVVEREHPAPAGAAHPLDPQHAAQCLAVHGDAHQVVATRHGRRAAATEAATEPTRSPAAERLGDEAQGAEPSAPAAASAAAPHAGRPQQLAQLTEDARVGRGLAALATFSGKRRERESARRLRARRGLPRPFGEATRRGAEPAATTAAAAPPAPPTTPTAEPEALGEALHVAGEQRGLDGIELLGVHPRFGEGVEHEGDARHD